VVASAWAICDVILLEGDNAYQQNWLYFTDISIFSPANTGGRILHSDRYIRVLAAMVLASLAEAIKRITVAMYFGKKTVRKWPLVETYEFFSAL
jgi:mannose/fructose-specific phosphotransferase system component IIA